MCTASGEDSDLLRLATNQIQWGDCNSPGELLKKVSDPLWPVSQVISWKKFKEIKQKEINLPNLVDKYLLSGLHRTVAQEILILILMPGLCPTRSHIVSSESHTLTNNSSNFPYLERDFKSTTLESIENLK